MEIQNKLKALLDKEIETGIVATLIRYVTIFLQEVSFNAGARIRNIRSNRTRVETAKIKMSEIDC
jgi:hypothetical protein